MRTLKLSCLSFTFIFFIVFLMRVACVSCQCLESERYHLLQLKASLKLPYGGRYSEKLVTWNNQSLDCGLWNGVVCSADGKVESLDLSNEGITEGVNDSSSLFSLEYLKRLNLAFNDFNSTFPTKFDKLINLNYLNLSHSGFSGQIPIDISNLVNLQTLHISGNSLYEYQSSSIKLENPNLDTLICNLSNLQELILHYVNISAKDDNWGRAISLSLPNLQVLSFSGCDLKGSIDFSLLKLRNLSEISLVDINLHGVFPIEIFQLQTLRAIDLSRNEKLQGIFPEISKNNSLEELVLSGTNFSGGIPNSIIENLESLSRLDISSCRLSGAIPKSLSNLTKLTYIDFSRNMFVGPIPSFTLLSGLTVLDLYDNHVTGSIHSTDWEGLTKLKYLFLDRNSLSGSIPMSVFRAPSLTYLSLNENQFNEISNEHLNMSSFPSQLAEIHLRSNTINGPFPHFVPQLKELSDLDLSQNNFSGPLPDFHLKNLRNLDLSSNNLSGTFPNSLSKCESLSSLDLSYNNFSGIFDLSMINQFWLLRVIDLSYSGFLVVDNGVDVPSSFPFLDTVSLASCRLRSFPGFLRNQSKLLYLDLSQNEISGEIPNWILEESSYLFSINLSHNFLEGIERRVLNFPPSFSTLDLHSNRLRGELPFFPQNVEYLDYSMNNFSSSIPPLIPNSELSFLYLSNNHLTGSIPESICNNSGIVVLDLSNNHLNGSISESICDTSWIQVLDLSNNHLNESIPESICNASWIQVLDLSNNSLSGPIPQCISTLNHSLTILNLGMNHLNGAISDAHFQPGCQLETLDLNGNRLSGKVPESLLNCKGLQVLNLGNNEIDDIFPCWLKELSNLSVLVLNSNNFHGKLGCPETNGNWPMLQIADLSSNTFSGKLFAKWFLLWKAMMVINEFKSISNRIDYGRYYHTTVTLNIKGKEVKLEKILTIYTSIDLSNNYFEGVIPEELGNLAALYCLNLSRNNFMGPIPPSLGNLKQLESLDLSRNKLSGTIPQQLTVLTFLQVLNMSFNQLEGRIPEVVSSTICVKIHFWATRD